jgi:DNA-binding CsgD family transcriptional regulator
VVWDATASEHRVAELAAAGLPNTEIAARLFITRKTAEHHLAAVYRKLNISSRRQLPGRLNRADPAPQELVGADGSAPTESV